MNLVNKFVSVAFLHITFVAGELYKGDECQLKNNRTGICKLLKECPEALPKIHKGIFPQQCGFEGIQVIVCCAQAEPTTAKTTEPPLIQFITPLKPTEHLVTQSKTPLKSIKPLATQSATHSIPTIPPDRESRPTGVVSNQIHECQLKNNRTGICKILTECPKAIRNGQKGISPQICGFEGIQVIVCCAQAESTTPKTTEPLATQSATSSIPTTTLDRESRLPGLVSNQKCAEYSKYVWITVTSIPLVPGGGGEIRVNNCPFKQQSLIVGAGGEDATRREFPHMVQFGYDASNGLRWTCGGSLISDQFVLTAAHCLSPRLLVIPEDHCRFITMGKIHHVLTW